MDPNPSRYVAWLVRVDVVLTLRRRAPCDRAIAAIPRARKAFGTNAHASRAERLARAKPKRYSADEIKKRTKRLALARKKRWAKKR